jgi:DNA-binding response OmpR family regulator
VLLVSTKRDTLDALRHRLEKFEFEVATASGPTAAIRCAIAKTPTVVLLDVQPYEMGSYIVCTAMQRDPKLRDVPVVVLRSPNDPHDKAYALKMGAVDCFDKPVQLDSLLCRLRACVFDQKRKRETRSWDQPILYATSSRRHTGMMRRAVNAKNFLKRTHYKLVPVNSLMAMREKLKEQKPAAIVMDEDVDDVETSLMCYSLKTDPKFRDLPIVVLVDRPDDAPRFPTADATFTDHAHRKAVDRISKLTKKPSKERQAT